ncbi:ras GTPase-activating protein-binding protein 2-like [Argonauta hians]
MVMEEPCPQWVGREFVRQYYTIMNEAPNFLHRFYSNNSSFVHGGIEKVGEEQQPVVGQDNIHKKILSLNFSDCRTKIRQVDSQFTVSNAVLIQVTGELSNYGQPMRRFMQTFVLAPQSPKKYYVHNDIFRYQDEVFPDSESDVENFESGGSEQENTETVTQTGPIQESVSQYYEQPSVLSNGNADLDEGPDSPAEKSVEEEPKEEVVEEPVSEPEKELEIKTPDPEPVPEIPAEPKPVSWASLASKNAPPSQPSTTTAGPAGHAQPLGKPQPTRSDGKLDMNQGPQPQRPRIQKDRMRERDRTSASRTDDGDSDSLSSRRGSRYPDSHQLFVGNLPHNITEKELRTYFENYGRVVELRINTKCGGGKLPNFGFVVFDTAEPVQHILSCKPIKYNGEHRLNVEEKKPRGAGGSGGGGGGGGGPEGGRPMSGRGGRGALGSGTSRGGIMGGNMGSGGRPGIRPTSGGGGNRSDNRLGGLSGAGGRGGGGGGPGAGGGGGGGGGGARR